MFMLSNSDNELIQNLYSEFSTHRILASRAINCKGNRRGQHYRVADSQLLNKAHLLLTPEPFEPGDTYLRSDILPRKGS